MIRKCTDEDISYEEDLRWKCVFEILYYCGLRKGELKVIMIHDFRHSCASLLINNGANITLVAKYLRHTKIEETLNTYSHIFSTALDSAVSVIDSLEDD